MQSTCLALLQSIPNSCTMSRRRRPRSPLSLTNASGLVPSPAQVIIAHSSHQRIDRIKSTLSSDLDHLFSSTLRTLTEGKEFARSAGSSDLDKTKSLADVTECLRTYDVLGLWQDAEEVLRTEVVRSFVKKVCPVP